MGSAELLPQDSARVVVVRRKPAKVLPALAAMAVLLARHPVALQSAPISQPAPAPVWMASTLRLPMYGEVPLSAAEVAHGLQHGLIAWAE